MEHPLVNVYCLVYNHGKYLRQCLESLATQHTAFPYTVIVHDDASTDNSPDIIREFAARYPSRIVPVFQSENQYGKGIVRRFIEPRVDAKYLAICEGDDYWSSPDKLQKQFDALESHPECGMCLHRTREVTESGEDTGLEYPMQVFPTGLLGPDRLFDSIEPRMFHTSSYFVRADAWRKYILHPPAYRTACKMGDLPLLLHFGSNYGVWQLNETLSCYRRGGASSWTSTRIKVDESYLIRHASSIVATYKAFDEETGGRYHWLRLRRTSKYLYAKCAHTKDFRDFLRPENRGCLSRLPWGKRASVFAGLLFPGLVRRIYLKHLVRKEQGQRARWAGQRKGGR